jgi:hypothetical protein
MTMNDMDLPSNSEAPTIQRLRPHHAQHAKALIRDVWREQFGTHTEAFVRDYLLLPNALARS